MIVIDAQHRDLEIVYGIRYQNYLLADNLQLNRARSMLDIALDNLRDAGYHDETIAAINEHVKLTLERAEMLNRPTQIVFVDMWSDEDIDPRDCDEGGQ